MSDARQPYVGPCPTTIRRAAMTDEEWDADVGESLARIYGLHTDVSEPDWYDNDPAEVTALDTPCPACGAVGPCMTDPNGLPLVHYIEAGCSDD